MDGVVEAATGALGQVYLIGTVHVSRKSAARVEEAVERIKPDVLCIELDINRYKAMMEVAKSAEGADPREGGHFRYSPSASEFLSIGGLLRWIQFEVGKEFGVMPGLEMLSAARSAQKHKIRLGLIDRRIEITLSRLWGQMPFGERVRLVSYIGAIAAVFLLKPIMGKRAYSLASLMSERKEVAGFEGGLDLNKVEKGEGVVELMEILRRQFPTIYTVLVEERNTFMSKNILNLLQQGAKDVVVVVGAGHVFGMKEILESKGVLVRVI